MTKFPYDRFAKDYFQELLSPFGAVETSRDVAGEVREIDIYFVPSSFGQIDIQMLGLLGRFAQTPALIESFRNPVQVPEVCSCTSKLLDVRAQVEREAKRNQTKVKQDSLPRLWILSPTASKAFLKGFNAFPDTETWPNGVYLFGKSWRGAIVVIHQLPATPETLWLRLLGRGKVHTQALKELLALEANHPMRSKAIDLLANLKTTLELNQNLDVEDREWIMQLSPVYEQRLVEAEQRGVQEGVQAERRTTITNLLQVRFGTIDAQLAAIVEPLLRLSPEEFTPLLVLLSREELLARFNQQ